MGDADHTLREKISFETSCLACDHQLVCHGDRAKLCANYEFGCSDKGFVGCNSCTNSIWRKNGNMCFKCNYFNSKGR